MIGIRPRLRELKGMAETIPDITALIERILPDVVQTRHHLHQNPELSGNEVQTSALVADRLQSLGLDEVQIGIAKHGVVGLLRGRTDGPMFALRADMDALPIQEASGLPYQSCNPGVMHACGHDGHTATLLGAAAVLSALRDRIHGTIKFIFQPAEETTGGAETMCAEGVMDGVDAIAALHGWPFLEVGQIGIRPGPMMASADIFDLTIKGKGGHAAYPHTAVDPIIVGAQIVGALQTLAAREISPLDSVVVSVTQFHAGTAHNVIPGQAVLAGTVRCLNPDLRTQMPGKMERIVAGICAALRAEYDFAYEFGPPVVVNDIAMTSLIKQIGNDVLGAESVRYLETPSMGAEDFAYYLPHAPGAMFRLGVGTDVSPLHTPTYNFTDAALPYGIRMFTELALRYGRAVR
jgi:amidohydrolase